MTIYAIFQMITMLALLVTASLIDIKTKKIPNYITLPAFIIAVILTIIYARSSFLENTIATIVCFTFGALGLMGLGDIKLIMCIIMLCGWHTALFGVLFSAFIFVAIHFLQHPDTIIGEIKKAVLGVFKGTLHVNGESRKAFAPYISVGTLISYVIITL